MSSLPQETIEVIKSLQKFSIHPILYGSQGVSRYIGRFKHFGDIDLLVDGRWMKESWQNLVAIMGVLGFKLIDEHEHEFAHHNGLLVAFADSHILIRDGITKSIEDATQTWTIGDVELRTLRPEVFLRVYEFSVNDGYRRESRGKKDSEVILLIKKYLAQEQG